MKIARIPVSSMPAGVPGLVAWVKAAHPGVYRTLAIRLRDANRLQGLGLIAPTAALSSVPQAVAAQTGMAQTLINTLKDIASTALPLYQQRKIFDMQLKRAAANQPPLDTSAISDISSVKLGVDSGTRNTAMLIAGGVAGVYLLTKLVGSRR